MNNKLTRVLLFSVAPLLAEALVFYLAHIEEIPLEIAGVLSVALIWFIYKTNQRKG